MKTKICFKCNAELSIASFYKHKQMADGFLGKCKECTKKDVAKRYLEHFDKIQEYEKERFKTKHRKSKILKYQKVRRKKYPIKNCARALANKAITSGLLVKQPCEKCGNDKAEMHHSDYLKPLDVSWLCFICHRKEHGQLKESPFNHET